MAGVYVRVRGIGAPIRSKARRWVGGRVGELVDGLAADADGVAGQGGEVVDQVAEAADGLFAGAGLEGGLGGGRWGAAGGGDGVAAGGRVLVGEGQRCPGLAQVPGAGSRRACRSARGLLTRSSSRCQMGRRSRSSALMCRKSRSRFARSL